VHSVGYNKYMFIILHGHTVKLIVLLLNSFSAPSVLRVQSVACICEMHFRFLLKNGKEFYV